MERRILVAVDGSKESMFALSWCIANLISETSNIKLVILYVKPTPAIQSFIATAIRIKTVASKAKEGSSSQQTIETDDNVPLAIPTTTTATITTPTITTVPTPKTSKLPPTTPKKRKPSTTGRNPNAGGNSPTASKKKQKKEISKSAVPISISGLDSRDVAPSTQSKNPPSTSNVMLEHIDSNLSSDNPQDNSNPIPTTSTPPSKTAAPINSSPHGDSSNLVQNKGSSNMAVPIGASEQPDDQGTSPPLKETNEATPHESAEIPPETSLPKSPLETPQESRKVTHAEEEKANSSQESEESGEEGFEEEDEEEEAQGGSSDGTESDAHSSENNDIEVVDLVDDGEDNEQEKSDGDQTNEPMEVDMDVTPLHMELPESSQSQMNEEELALLRRNDPIGYMKAKLAQRDTPLARASTNSTNNPMPSDDRVVLLNKIRRTILDVDLFEVLKKDGTACYSMKELLMQVNLAACSLEVSTILFDLQDLLDNVSGCLLQDEFAAAKVQEKRNAMEAAYKHASKLSKEAEDQALRLQQAKTDYEARTQSILLWEKQIQELQQKVKEAQQQQLAHEANTVGNQFEETLNKGLAEMEAAVQLKGEVATLEGAKRFTQQRLESLLSTFDRLKNNAYF